MPATTIETGNTWVGYGVLLRGLGTVCSIIYRFTIFSLFYIRRVDDILGEHRKIV